MRWSVAAPHRTAALLVIVAAVGVISSVEAKVFTSPFIIEHALHTLI